MKRSPRVALIFAFLVGAFVSVAAFIDEIGNIVALIGITTLVVIIPLIIALVLPLMKAGMIITDLIGDVLMVLIGDIGLEEANKQILEAIPTVLGVTIPIINSAIAMVVFKTGSYPVTSTLAGRGIKGKVGYVLAFIVILLTAATYMPGIGSGSAAVIVPLAFATVDTVPELIVTVPLAVVVSFTTSPASLESSIVSKSSNISVGSYVSTMRPYWLFPVALATVLAFWETERENVGFKESTDNGFDKKSNDKLFKITLPAIFLLFAVILRPIVDNLVGFAFFTPFVYMILTLVLILLYTDFSMNRSVGAIVDGFTYILTRLFQVGIFLTLINVTAQTGAPTIIAGVAENAPAFTVVPVAVLARILIGIPAGTCVGFVLTLVPPVAVPSNFPPSALGFVAIDVGLGSQVSFVNITIQALSLGFQTPISDIVKENVKWLNTVSILLLVIDLIFGQRTV